MNPGRPRYACGNPGALPTPTKTLSREQRLQYFVLLGLILYWSAPLFWIVLNTDTNMSKSRSFWTPIEFSFPGVYSASSRGTKLMPVEVVNESSHSGEAEATVQPLLTMPCHLPIQILDMHLHSRATLVDLRILFSVVADRRADMDALVPQQNPTLFPTRINRILTVIPWTRYCSV